MTKNIGYLEVLKDRNEVIVSALVFMAIRDKEQHKKHGVVRDERGQDQPKDKDRAQQAGLREQKEAAEQQSQWPGEPAKGE